MTPLHVAAANGQLEIVRYFTITRGCDPEVRSDSNHAPLGYAVHNGHIETVKFLSHLYQDIESINEEIVRATMIAHDGRFQVSGFSSAVDVGKYTQFNSTSHLEHAYAAIQLQLHLSDLKPIIV